MDQEVCVSAQRTEEIEFLVSMPAEVYGWRIVYATGYKPGDDGSYPSMIVVLFRRFDHYATARLIWQVGAPEGNPAWLWEHGNYDIDDLNEARENANRRAGVSS